MGRPNPKTLSDLDRYDANLRATCVACGHWGDFTVRPIVDYFLWKRWNTALDVAGGRFRCEKCGHRGARLGLAPKYEEPRPRETPAPLTAREIRAAIRRERG